LLLNSLMFRVGTSSQCSVLCASQLAMMVVAGSLVFFFVIWNIGIEILLPLVTLIMICMFRTGEIGIFVIRIVLCPKQSDDLLVHSLGDWSSYVPGKGMGHQLTKNIPRINITISYGRWAFSIKKPGSPKELISLQL
jgi:hypothetical protein